MNVLSADGFVLEPQTALHAAALFALLQDPAIYRHENEPPPAFDAFRERLQRLEWRRSPDGRQAWLNWIVRCGDGEVAGYVQATVHDTGDAWVAYVLGSPFWGRGLGCRAVARMLLELESSYAVHTAWAVFKRRNAASRRLLERLSFEPARESRVPDVEKDEDVYLRRLRPARTAQHGP